MISRLIRTLRLPLATLVTALTVFALCTAPASAHQSIVEQGEDYAITDSDHRSGSVCDWESDGNFVLASWEDASGKEVGSQEDGGDGGCDETTFSGKAETVSIYEINLNSGHVIHQEVDVEV